MKSGTSHTSRQRLRKRHIVIAGYGTSVVAFCNRFRSEWAEVTVVSSVSDHAPQVVRHGIAAGHLLPEVFSRLLRVRFGKHDNIKFVSDDVVGIDTQTRTVTLRNSGKTLTYDYLLIGNQVTEQSEQHLNSCADAKFIAASFKHLQEKPVLHIRGADANAIDLAATFTKTPAIRIGKITPGKVILDCVRGFEFPNFEVTAKTENRFAKDLRWESISLLDAETAAAVSNNSQLLVPFLAQIPKWIPIADGADLPHGSETLKKLLRPDLRLRSDERIYLMPELVSMVDSVGKQLASEDLIWMRQGNYLAKTLRGIIEAKKRYLVDPPGFVLASGSSFATVRMWKSIGFFNKRVLPPSLSFLIDMISVKLPVFNLVYGRFEGWVKLFQWLRECK